MNQLTRSFVAIGIVLLGLFLPDIASLLNLSHTPVREVLLLEEPSEESIKQAQEIDIVTNRQDRNFLSILNYEFCNRVNSYKAATIQDYNDIYNYVIKDVYGTKLSGKYDNLSKVVQNAFIESVGDTDGFATDVDKKALTKRFNSFAWVLGDE